MATKKPTAKQIAARKLFAERARAGAFAPKSKRAKTEKNKRHFSQDSGVEAAEAKLRIARKVAARRKANPVKRGDSFRNHVSPIAEMYPYQVTNADGSEIVLGTGIAVASVGAQTLSHAQKVATELANRTLKQMRITSR